MPKYINRHVVMISDEQVNSLSILKAHNVNIGQFIRAAIKEKIVRDWKSIQRIKNNCPTWANN